MMNGLTGRIGRSLARLLVIGCLTAWAGALPVSAAGPHPLYGRALELMKKKDFQQGVTTYYKFLLLAEPSLSADARKHDLAGAFMYFTERRKQDPNDTRALFFLSLIDRCVHRMDRAGTQLDQVRNKHPKSNLLTFVKGEYCIVQEKISEGTGLFVKLKDTPLGAKLWKVAEFLMKRNGIETKGLERKQALLRKAYRYIDLMEREQAEGILKTLVKEFPDDPEPARALIELYLEWKKDDAAQAVADAWKKSQGRSPLAPLQEGRLAYQLGRYPDAIKVLEPLLKREPENEYAGMFLAESYFQTGRYEKAAELFQGFYDKDDANVSLAIRFATCLECTGKADKAIEVLDAAVLKNPKDLLIQLELGGVMERAGKLVDAAGYYRRVAFEPNPLQEMANQKLAAIYKRTLEENPAIATQSAQPAVTDPQTQDDSLESGEEEVGEDEEEEELEDDPPDDPRRNIAPPEPGYTPKTGNADRPRQGTSDPAAAVRQHQAELNRGLSNVFK